MPASSNCLSYSDGTPLFSVSLNWANSVVYLLFQGMNGKCPRTGIRKCSQESDSEGCSSKKAWRGGQHPHPGLSLVPCSLHGRKALSPGLSPAATLKTPRKMMTNDTVQACLQVPSPPARLPTCFCQADCVTVTRLGEGTWTTKTPTLQMFKY